MRQSVDVGGNMPAAAIRGFVLPHWARLGALALCYFAAAKASLVFAIPPGYATAVWPPSGIALAALLLWGARAWPGVWLGAVLTNYSIDLSIPAALGIATGNTLEGVCIAWLAGRLTDRNAEFTQPEKVFVFAAVAALGSAIAATVGVSSLYLTGAAADAQFAGNWYTWWQGDTTGILLVTPCILAWARGTRGGETRAGAPELALFGTLLVAMLLAVFARSPEANDTRALAFLAMPFFVWAACRFSERAVTLTVLAANGWAIWCTVNGLGPFQASSLNEALLMLQAFTSAGALITLVLWALLRYRADAYQLLQDSRQALGQAAESRTHALSEQIDAYRDAQALAHVGSWSWGGGSSRVVWSDEFRRICGIDPAQSGDSFEAYFARVHPADRERARATIKNAYAKHCSWDSIERMIHADGKIHTLRSIGRAVPRKDGVGAHMHGAIVDVTGTMQPQAVEGAQKVLERFRSCAEEFERHSGITVDVVGGNLAGNLDGRTVRALLWIAREALHNVTKHARARRVEMEFECEGGLAALMIRDDGNGFAPEWQQKQGTGVTLMHDRAEAAGGRLWVESTPGSGTTLRVTARG
ncbi:MAG TPA: MASE1 domain-containing protein [Burkholderiales bacterium]|nr:MASE1 domain-containing protein [Burkholderiales bacterium]